MEALAADLGYKQPSDPFFSSSTHMVSIVNREWPLADYRSRAPNALCSNKLDTA